VTAGPGDLLLPQFLGIGAVKAGTTWLHRNLRQHPALYLPAAKPVRYFDRHRDKPIATYSALFAPGADRLRGEFSASYSVLPRATIEDIHRLMPDLKLILLLREPRARAWSEAKMEFSVVRGLGPAPRSEAEYVGFLTSQQCRERGDYRTIIRNWTSVFPRDRLFIGLMEDVRDAPEALFGRVLDFLGVPAEVDYAGYPLRQKIFEGLALEPPDRCRAVLDALYTADDVRKLDALVDMDLVRRWGYA
jgi:hypothetical protein